MNLRKLLLFSVPPLLLLVAAFIIFKMWAALKQNEKQKSITKQLPSMTLRKLDGTALNTISLKDSKELLVLNYFNTDCDHCQSMVRELFRNRSLLDDVNWLMITSNTVDKTKHFAESMNLSLLPNVILLSDTASLFTQTFGAVSVPSFYVYKTGKLLRMHTGECSLAYLLEH